MADVVGHPWMQGPHASTADVKAEFAMRHQKVQEVRQQEAEKNKIEKANWQAQRGVRRGDRIGDKVYLDISAEQVSEECKDPSVKILQACKFDYQPGKNTQFFSTYETTYVFSKLVEYLKDHQIKFNLSDKYFKIEFEAEKMPDQIDDAQDGEETKTDTLMQPAEKVNGKIEIQKVDETMVCIDFSRKGGSAWLFYEKFNFIKKDLAELSDAKFEPTF